MLLEAILYLKRYNFMKYMHRRFIFIFFLIGNALSASVFGSHEPLPTSKEVAKEISDVTGFPDASSGNIVAQSTQREFDTKQDQKDLCWKIEYDESCAKFTLPLNGIDINTISVMRDDDSQTIEVLVPAKHSVNSLIVSSHGRVVISEKRELKKESNQESIYACEIAQKAEYLPFMLDLNNEVSATFAEGLLQLTLHKKKKITTIPVIKK